VLQVQREWREFNGLFGGVHYPEKKDTESKYTCFMCSLSDPSPPKGRRGLVSNLRHFFAALF
jgi:hypothetical protein